MHNGFYMVTVYDKVRYGEIIKIEKSEYRIPSKTTVTTNIGEKVELTYDAYFQKYCSQDKKIVIDVKDYIKKQIESASIRKSRRMNAGER